MGVRSLKSYITKNAHHYLRPYELHDCSIVIDGHNLAFVLYEKQAALNSAFGGDYDLYYRAVVKFFRTLGECNVKSFVILDGSIEKKKLNTAKTYFSSKIKMLKNVTWNSAKLVTPSLIIQVFLDALRDCSVPFTRALFEADKEVAALSAKLNCPVLSDDSDFYIFDVKFLPLSKLSSTPYEAAQNCKYLKCYMYEVNYLTGATSLDHDMMPLLAVLLGNDYVEPSKIRAIMGHVFSMDGVIGAKVNELYIIKILQWLSNETYNSALEKIMGTLETERRDEFFNLLTAGMESYKIRICTSYEFFRTHYKEIIGKCTNNFEGETEKSENKELEAAGIEEKTIAHSLDGCQKLSTLFPPWFKNGMVFNKIEKYIATLLHLSVIFASPQIEHFDFEDSNKIALPILKHTFTILHNIDGKEEDRILNPRKTPNVSDSNVPFFWYFGRTNVSVKEDCVKCEVGPPPVVPFNPHNPDPKLLQSIFNGLQLDCPELFKKIDELPSDLRLYILGIIYWTHNSRHVSLIHLRSILVCLVVLRTIDSKITPIRNINDFDYQFRRYIRYTHGFRSMQRRRELTDKWLQNLCPSERIKYISKRDCVLVQRNLLKHFHIHERYTSQYTQYCTPILHVFAELQSVLFFMTGLNGLLKNIYENAKMGQSYCGVFIFNMYELLTSQVDEDHYIQHQIFHDSMMFDFYKFLWDWICNFIPSSLKTIPSK